MTLAVLGPWSRKVLAAVVGGVGLIVLGQLLALAGGSCTILCRPPVAGLFGAVLGLVLVGPGRRA